MLKTRNLFVLKGNESDVDLVLRSLQFKGLTQLSFSNVTVDDIFKEFQKNKSVVCSNCPEELKSIAIEVNVINTTEAYKGKGFCLNIMDEYLPQYFQNIANALDCDIGDHKSDSSGLNGAPKVSDCPYCMQLIDNGFTRNLNINRILYKSNNFIVTPTLGEFIKGYLLIIPISHVMSIATLTSSDLHHEFLTVLDDTFSILEATYPINKKDILVWENGTGNGGIGKAKSSIVHAHVHVAPSKLTANSIIEYSKFPLTRISYGKLSSYGNHSYLLVRGKDNNEWYINDDPDLYIPRQYVRQLLAEEYELLDSNAWNWRTHPFVNLMKSTCSDIQNALIKNWSSLSDRIKQNTKNYLL